MKQVSVRYQIRDSEMNSFYLGIIGGGAFTAPILVAIMAVDKFLRGEVISFDLAASFAIVGCLVGTLMCFALVLKFWRGEPLIEQMKFMAKWTGLVVWGAYLLFILMAPLSGDSILTWVNTILCINLWILPTISSVLGTKISFMVINKVAPES